MSTLLRKSLFCASLLALGLTYTASVAQAATMQDDLVRTAQLNLAARGYFVGEYDGRMNAATTAAIRDFQAHNGLDINGKLTPDTFATLSSAAPTKAYAYYPTQYAYYPANYAHNFGYGYAGYTVPMTTYSDDTMTVTWNDRWHYVRSQNIPVRFGKLDVTEETRAGMRHYAVTLNGRAVLFAENQPSLLRVSQTFKLDGEDTVLFTAYNGDGACAYKTYMLNIKNDGTTDGPRLFGNCSGNMQAHVADAALFVSFPGSRIGDDWGTWDTWRYENGALVRM